MCPPVCDLCGPREVIAEMAVLQRCFMPKKLFKFVTS